MTPLLSRRRKIVLAGGALLALFGSSACLTLTPGTPAGTPTAPRATATAAAGTQIYPETSAIPPAASPTANAATAQAAIVFGPGPLIFTNTIAGLAELDSYTATLKYTFDGTRDGKPEQWSKTYVMLTTKAPATRQLNIATTGNIPEAGAIFMAEAAGAAYERHGTAGCTASVMKPGKSLADWL